jgi:hypothetical protein
MRINKVFVISLFGLSLTAFSSYQFAPTLRGTWQFAGGIYNGKREGATKGYTLQRTYNSAHYEAFLLEKGHKAEKYEAGNYRLKGDTCIDTETYSVQTSKITHVPIHYLYSLRHDTLTLKATLPTGMRVEEYWKRIK